MVVCAYPALMETTFPAFSGKLIRAGANILLLECSHTYGPVLFARDSQEYDIFNCSAPSKFRGRRERLSNVRIAPGFLLVRAFLS